MQQLGKDVFGVLWKHCDISTRLTLGECSRAYRDYSDNDEEVL